MAYLTLLWQSMSKRQLSAQSSSCPPSPGYLKRNRSGNKAVSASILSVFGDGLSRCRRPFLCVRVLAAPLPQAFYLFSLRGCPVAAGDLFVWKATEAVVTALVIFLEKGKTTLDFYCFLGKLLSMVHCCLGDHTIAPTKVHCCDSLH